VPNAAGAGAAAGVLAPKLKPPAAAGAPKGAGAAPNVLAAGFAPKPPAAG
jgi:hypothetical protein